MCSSDLGFKLAFLTSRMGLYQQSQDSKTVTTFYNKVTLDFIKKYGEDEPFHKELAEDPPDPEDIEEDEDDPPPSKEEAEASAVIFTKLRTVSANV